MADNKQQGLRLNMDIGTSLLIEIQGVDGKIKSKLIGMEAWEYLIIKAPVGYTGIRNKLVEGNRIVIRFIQEGSVFGFDAYILAVIDKPTTLLVIDYPRKIEEKSLRVAKRLDCYIPCTLLIDQQQTEGSMVNISTGGCRFVVASQYGSARKSPEKDNNVVIVFDSPAESWKFELPGVIVNTSEYYATASFGVRFETKAEDQQRHIERLIEYLERHL